jgi:FkbM family methyltransferase
MTLQNGPGADDAPYSHFSTKHRIVAWISQNLFDHVTYTVRSGLNAGMKRKGGLGWIPDFLRSAATTPEHEFWAKLDLSGQVVYDVGAFHGLLTLYFASKADRVVSYEPNTRNHARLLENLRLNGLKNVVVRKAGVGDEGGTAQMFSRALTPGAASVEPNAVAQFQSEGSVDSEQIVITTLDDDIRSMSLPPPDFIKIDIEGAELPALVGARNTLITCRPRLFLEMHGETMNLKRKKVAAIVDYLSEAGYRNIRHVESGSAIGVENSSVAAIGHLDCQWE